MFLKHSHHESCTCIGEKKSDYIINIIFLWRTALRCYAYTITDQHSFNRQKTDVAVFGETDIHGQLSEYCGCVGIE